MMESHSNSLIVVSFAKPKRPSTSDVVENVVSADVVENVVSADDVSSVVKRGVEELVEELLQNDQDRFLAELRRRVDRELGAVDPVLALAPSRRVVEQIPVRTFVELLREQDSGQDFETDVELEAVGLERKESRIRTVEDAPIHDLVLAVRPSDTSGAVARSGNARS